MGAILTDARVTAELIADGVHVQPAALRLTVAAKGPDGVILVSDATSATGMPEGSYQLGPLRVTVREGVCRNEEGKLAGSVLTLDRALRTMVKLGFDLSQVVRMLTLNPARLLGLERRKGVIRARGGCRSRLSGPGSRGARDTHRRAPPTFCLVRQ